MEGISTNFLSSDIYHSALLYSQRMNCTNEEQVQGKAMKIIRRVSVFYRSP